MAAAQAHENRVLVLTPTGDDGRQACQVLAKASIVGEVVDDCAHLAEELAKGAGATILAQEGVTDGKVQPLLDELGQQPTWSDLPLLMIVSRPDAESSGRRFLDLFSEVGSVFFLERPLKPITLITAVRSALRARRRQYQVRDLFLEQRKLYEKAAEAIRIRDEFISIASHELKTPITSLKLRIEIAAREFDIPTNRLPSPSRLQRLFSVGTYQIARLNSLVDDMLDVSRIQSGKMTMNLEFSDLAQTLVASLDRLREHISLAGSNLVVAPLHPVWGQWDATRLEQVVVNLVSNALKYAPGSTLQIGLEAEGNRAILWVRDDGPGIPPEQHSRLFHQFERANASKNSGGLGLGLYIVRQIVEAHGGEVRLDSAASRGAKFTIELPIRGATAL